MQSLVPEDASPTQRRRAFEAEKLKPLKLEHIIWSDEKLCRSKKTSKSGQNMQWPAAGFGNKRQTAKAKPDAAVMQRVGQSPGSMAHMCLVHGRACPPPFWVATCSEN